MPPSYKNFITDAFGRFSQSDSAKTRWETANNLILMIDDNHYTIRADGTFDGQFGGKPMTETWKWKRKFWCRQLTTHSKNYDCQVWLADGNKFTIIREKGKGKTAVLTAN